ncbi:conserved hypothetical protein [Leishmania braziliensis MHOM/BR/75/M2904]|uniref:Uncharacterized protein n=2 Tax=Leishmania braziliensis TaxID=5660 RepID=A4H5M9_LEIBR|nr:conserved hypothetical protein [Leishmania braziliensis MHOM/BR/75/M2904]KAI5690689.1 hypothetical protein MNV84_01116 [Leishmania braziliensis]CAJ2467410.1 unnamed protein product [Leishmania braziliensis]CAJ2468015.1 unnamed protein product [Leishmania braziliensis]CAM41793.1 conserved hypothetical protein [Leishmania braziliensis MHOM/BR/75/M2904]SYZ63274.1 hypothetical_protein [Leishmania braziliensis MHOM/BR/75/M2904]
MSAAVQTLATVMATDMIYYAGDPTVLTANVASNRIVQTLQSSRSDQLTARVAIHAQLREAFKSADVQQRLKPFLSDGEDMQMYVQDAKARARFFSQKQQELQHDILQSEEQRQLKEAHGELAAWERENAVLLRHQMFMTYMPSQALLLESAATVALYRQYATLEEGQYTSDSSDGEVPAMLKKMGGKAYFTQSAQPFEVDAHNKMFSQQVLQNKRVEYEQMREKVAQLRQALEECPTVKRLEAFVELRNDIFAEYGIDRLASLCSRKDKEMANPNEGGVDASLHGLPADNEYVSSSRVAQYSLPKIVDAAYKNYLNILSMDDWDAMIKRTNSSAREVIEKIKPIKDKETFRYWFLSCITADVPQMGPNKIVGQKVTTLEDYKKFWAPQKSNYVPSLTSSRGIFGSKVADRHGLPHFLILAPVTYRYRENNDPNAVKTGTIDLMVYDATNEKVLLMLTNSSDERRPRAAFLNAQEERYRFAAVVRSAITYENQYHGFECEGTVAEYFFDAKEGPEENYYCIMAPHRVYNKQSNKVEVPMKALRPFTSCPPRYFLLGSNWGVSAGTSRNPYPASYAHVELNEYAVSLSNVIPDGFISSKVLPQLLSRAEGIQKLEEEKKRQQRAEAEKPQPSPRALSRTPRGSAATPHQSTSAPSLDNNAAEILAEENMRGPGEEEDPLSPVVPKEVLQPVRDELLKQRPSWRSPAYIQLRARDPSLKQLPAVKDGHLRTPLSVFNNLMKEKHGEDAPPMSAPTSARRSTEPPSSCTASGL